MTFLIIPFLFIFLLAIHQKNAILLSLTQIIFSIGGDFMLSVNCHSPKDYQYFAVKNLQNV